MRRAASEPERLVRLAEVLAELHGVDPAGLVADAEKLAGELAAQGVPIVKDWGSYSCLPWVDAAKLLSDWREERDRTIREHAERRARQEHPAYQTAGVVVERPGEAKPKGWLDRLTSGRVVERP